MPQLKDKKPGTAYVRLDVLMAEAGIDYQDFTPAEQKCISGKISEFVKEGEDQDQAIAKAISICAPSKVKMESPQPIMQTYENTLGEKFVATENSDGTFNIFDVPVFAEHLIKDQDGNVLFKIDRKFLKRAVRVNQRRASEGYLAPLHIRHHPNSDPEFIGRFVLRGIGSTMYEGRELATVFADFIGIPAQTFERILKGELAYRSVEILDIKSGEIDSCSLLSNSVPFFRFALLTGDNIEIRREDVGRAHILHQSRTPALAYRAIKRGYSVLWNFSEVKMLKDKHGNIISESATDRRHKFNYDDLRYAGHDEDEEKRREDEKLQEEEEKEEEPEEEKMDDHTDEGENPEDRMMAAIEKLTEMVGKIGEAILGEGAEEIEDAAEEATEDEDLPVVEMDAPKADPKLAKLAARADTDRARLVKLEKKVDHKELVLDAMKELNGCVIDKPEKLETKLYELLKEGGEKHMRVYVDTVKEHADTDSAGEWTGELDKVGEIPVDLREFAAMGTDKLEKVMEYSKLYDQLNSSRSAGFQVDRKTFVLDQLEAEGVYNRK